MSRWLLTVVFDWALIAAAVGLFGLVPTWYGRLAVLPAAVAVITCRQHALQVMGHEATHGLVCRPRWLNDLLGELFCFAPFGGCGASFRSFHLAHHKHLGTAEDTERQGREELARLGIRWPLPMTRSYFLREVVLGVVGARFYVAVAFVWSVRPRTPGGVALVLVWWATALAALYLTGAWWVLALWVVPVLTALWSVTWVRMLYEHTGADGGTNRFAPNWWQRFLVWPHNIGLHYEHHARPNRPWHELAGLRSRLSGPEPVSVGTLFWEMTRGNQDRVRGEDQRQGREVPLL